MYSTIILVHIVSHILDSIGWNESDEPFQKNHIGTNWRDVTQNDLPCQRHDHIECVYCYAKRFGNIRNISSIAFVCANVSFRIDGIDITSNLLVLNTTNRQKPPRQEATTRNRGSDSNSFIFMWIEYVATMENIAVYWTFTSITWKAIDRHMWNTHTHSPNVSLTHFPCLTKHFLVFLPFYGVAKKKWGKKTSSVKIATACATFLTFNFNIRYLTVCLYYWHWYEVIADSLDSSDNLKAHIFWYQTEHLHLDEIQFGSIDYLIRSKFDTHTKNVTTIAHRTISKNFDIKISLWIELFVVL